MRELVSYLHAHQQHYIVMVDPAVAYQNYSAFNNGKNLDIFMKDADGLIFQGVKFEPGNGCRYCLAELTLRQVVWPGVTAFPDWFHPDTQKYWNDEFGSFFNPDTGLDISALWIDMNEAAKYVSIRLLDIRC